VFGLGCEPVMNIVVVHMLGIQQRDQHIHIEESNQGEPRRLGDGCSSRN